VWKPTLVHLLEQLLGIALTAFFLGRVPAGNLEKSCAAVTLARVAADVVSLLLMALAFFLDRRRYRAAEAGAKLTLRMLHIAVPLALSAYARSALTTLQHLLVPRGLRAAGLSANRALASYGTVQGMVLPVIFFPACIMAAVSELIVPELTAAQVQADRPGIRRTTRELLRLSLLFSLAVGLFLFVCADALGMLIYGSRDAGHFIRILAPLVPFSYLDMSVDGCLKGLGQQVWCMGVNILDGLLGLVLRLVGRHQQIAVQVATDLLGGIH
jgi:stage V sporulation protein B